MCGYFFYHLRRLFPVLQCIVGYVLNYLINHIVYCIVRYKRPLKVVKLTVLVQTKNIKLIVNIKARNLYSIIVNIML